MKNRMKILSILALLAAAVLAVTPAWADEGTPPPPGEGQNQSPERGQLSELMTAAFAAETGLTVEEVRDLRESGMSLVQIAQDLGYEGEDLKTLMEDVGNAALDLAVVDGVISEEKAEMITLRRENYYFGMIFDKLFEALDLTKEDIVAMLESGMTLHEIALQQGVEFGGHLAGRCGMTREEIITGVNGGKTLKELCPGIMMPEGGWPKENLFKK
jgi:hypothetical protein